MYHRSGSKQLVSEPPKGTPLSIFFSLKKIKGLLTYSGRCQTKGSSNRDKISIIQTSVTQKS